MSSNTPARRRHLIGAFDHFSPSDFLRMDLPIGLLGGVGALVLSLTSPERLVGLTSAALGIVGVIVGAVLAGVSIQAAFLDTSFLRKLDEIGRDPVRYLTPFLFTAVLGIWAMLSLLVLGALKSTDWQWLLALTGTVSGFLTAYAVASLLPGLSTLVQFIELRHEAALIPDDQENA